MMDTIKMIFWIIVRLISVIVATAATFITGTLIGGFLSVSCFWSDLELKNLFKAKDVFGDR